jgi:hypothetical protein
LVSGSWWDRRIRLSSPLADHFFTRSQPQPQSSAPNCLAPVESIHWSIVNLAGAANDFEALERLRKLAFSETVPPKIPEQLPLELPDVTDDNEEV